MYDLNKQGKEKHLDKAKNRMRSRFTMNCTFDADTSYTKQAWVPECERMRGR